jgi:glycosyltransferase involved in cell wall biosynthesis
MLSSLALSARGAIGQERAGGEGASKSADSLAAVAPAAAAAPDLSIIVPCLNEAASLVELAQAIRASLEGRESYEILFVDDGSSDDSWAVISGLRAGDPRCKGIRLRKNFGKAMALSAGFQRAQGAIFITMDADLQDDPVDLPAFIAKIRAGEDVVVGWRVSRRSPTNQLILSRIFNGTTRRALRGQLHDMNCGLKAYRREVIRSVPVYGDLFRFLPAFAAWEGFRITELPVQHHARKHGTSHYGFERVLGGFFDLFSVMFLTRFKRKPMHFFGPAGLLLTGLGLTTELLGGDGLLGAVEILAGIQLWSIGFIGEFLAYRNHRRVDAAELPIREELT